MHALLIALVLSQTVYEWTDSKGIQHFTDDLQSVPKGAKVRTTKGADVTVVPASPQPAPSTTDVKRSGVNTCDVARAQISELEQQRERQRQDLSRLREAEAAKCREQLAVRGHGSYAQCSAGIEQRVNEQTSMQDKSVETQLEALRESLRRAQVEGCR